jgi:hypothetical protein
MPDHDLPESRRLRRQKVVVQWIVITADLGELFDISCRDVRRISEAAWKPAPHDLRCEGRETLSSSWPNGAPKVGEGR